MDMEAHSSMASSERVSAAVEQFLRGARGARASLPRVARLRMCQAAMALIIVAGTGALVVAVSFAMARADKVGLPEGALVALAYVPLALAVAAAEFHRRRIRAKREIGKDDARSGVQLIKAEELAAAVRGYVQRTRRWPTLSQVKTLVRPVRIDVDAGEEWTCVVHDTDGTDDPENVYSAASAWLVRCVFTSIESPGVLGQARIATDWVCLLGVGGDAFANGGDMTPVEMATALLLARRAVAFSRDIQAFRRGFASGFAFALSGAPRVHAADGDRRVVARKLGPPRLPLLFETDADRCAEDMLDGAWQAWEEHREHVLRHHTMAERFASLYDALAASSAAPKEFSAGVLVPRVPSL